jgi:hypothetical protein
MSVSETMIFNHERCRGILQVVRKPLQPFPQLRLPSIYGTAVAS